MCLNKIVVLQKNTTMKKSTFLSSLIILLLLVLINIDIKGQADADYLLHVKYYMHTDQCNQCKVWNFRNFKISPENDNTVTTVNLDPVRSSDCSDFRWKSLRVEKACVLRASSGNHYLSFWDGVDDHYVLTSERDETEPVLILPNAEGTVIKDGHYYSNDPGVYWYSAWVDISVVAYQIPQVRFNNVYSCITTKDTKDIGLDINPDTCGLAPNARYYIDFATEPLKRFYLTFWPFNEKKPEMNTIEITSYVKEKQQSSVNISWNELAGKYSSSWWGKTIYLRVRADFNGISSCYDETVMCEEVFPGISIPVKKTCDNNWWGPSPGSGFVIDNSNVTLVIQKFPPPTVSANPPSCKGYFDASVTLGFNVDDVTRYNFSISKLVKKANSTDKCSETNGAGGVGNPSDDNYCFTGEGASISGIMSNSSITIDNNALLDDGTKPNGTGLKDHFGAGDYEITAELKPSYGISCIFTTIISIPEAPELILNSASPKNSYTWDGKTYQIKGYGDTDAIEINLSGGHPPYRYSVDNGTTYSIATNNTTYLYNDVYAGNHTVRITDAHNCKSQGDKTIPIQMEQPDTITIKGFEVDSVSCHINNAGVHDDGRIQFEIKGGIGPYNITLNTLSNTGSNPAGNFAQLEDLQVNSYNVIVRDRYITSWDSIVNVPSHSQLGFKSITDTALHWPNCIGGSDGYINLGGYGGKFFNEPNYQFGILNTSDTSWSSNNTILNLDALHPYSLVIKDQLGCNSRVDNIIIPQNPNPLKSTLNQITPPLCYTFSDGKAQFTGSNGRPFSSGYDFALRNIGTHDEYTYRAFTHQFEGLKKGIYEISIKDQYDCVINNYYRDTIEIGEPDQIDIQTTTTQVSRKGLHNGSIHADLSGGNNSYEYQWYKGLAAISDSLIKSGTTDNSTLIDNLSVGDYLLQVKDINGCNNGQGDEAWFEWTTHISEPAKALSFTVKELKNVSCKGLENGRLVVEGTGGWGNNYRYGLQPDKLSYDGDFNNLKAGLYTVYVVDEQGEVFQDNVTVSEPETLTATQSLVVQPKCYEGNDGSIDLSVLGGTQPYYISANNNVNRIQGSSISGLSAGLYRILVTDSNQCETSVDVTITQPDPLQIDLADIVQTSCGNATGSISATYSGGTPGYTYQWLNSKNNAISTSSTIQNIPADIYKVILTDANSCYKESPWFIVSNSDGPTVTNTEITPVTCFGDSDGKAKIMVDKGIPPYTFEWSNGQETDIASGLQSGSYSVTIKDSKNCPNTISVDIPTPTLLTIENITVTNPQCFGYSNGSISVNGQGGVSPYQYAWSNGHTGDSIVGLKAGEYSVIVTDSHNCTANRSSVLNDPDPVFVNIGSTATICGGQTISLNAGNFASFNWTSDNGFSSQNRIVNLNQQGNYYLEVIDSHGCIGRDSFILHTSNSLLSADFLIKSEAFVGDTVVAIDVSWPIPDSTYWLYDTKTINHFSTADYENLIFTKPGTYQIEMYATLGDCRDNYSHEITIKTKDIKGDGSSKEEPLIKKFTVYPNPNSGNFIVEVELNKENDIVLNLFGGSTLMDNKKIKGLNKYTVEYNLPRISPGIYIIQLITGKEQKNLKMIIY